MQINSTARQAQQWILYRQTDIFPVVPLLLIFKLFLIYYGWCMQSDKLPSRFNWYKQVCSKVIGMVHLQDVYNKRVRNKTNAILSESSHPLHQQFELLPSSSLFRHTHQSKPTDTSTSLFLLLPPLILMIMLGPVGAHCDYHINYLIIYWQFICFHRCLCASCFYALLCFCTYLVFYFPLICFPLRSHCTMNCPIGDKTSSWSLTFSKFSSLVCYEIWNCRVCEHLVIYPRGHHVLMIPSLLLCCLFKFWMNYLMNVDQDSCSIKNKLHPHILLKMVSDTPNAKAVLGKGLAVSHICVVPLAYNCFPSEFPFQS